MARRIVEIVFNPKQPLLVRREFKAAGRTFRQGDEFLWSRFAIPVRRVKLMFEAGMLMHVVHQPTDEVVHQPADDNSDLDADSLMILQAIARKEGAAFKSTKTTQRQAIIDKRQG